MSTRGRKRAHPVVRKDPKTRTPDGARPWDKLKNPNPAMHYVVASPNDPLQGVRYYETLGYEPVVRTEGGVSAVMAVGEKNSTFVMAGPEPGLLMQIPLGDPKDPQQGTKAWLDAPGQAHCDEVEKRIIKKGGGGYDGLRGQHGYTEIVNETSRNRTVEVRHG
jgi:hypothetical protein